MERKRAIICDDDEVFRFIIRRQLGLKIQNLFISDANSGEELEEVIKNTEPDVIIMDISMSGENGISLTRRLVEKNKDINIIICSSNEDIHSVVSSFNAGAKGFFSKNATAELCRAIQHLLLKKHALSGEIKICSDSVAKLIETHKNAGFDHSAFHQELTLQVFS